ncbi:MAG: diguanylate cyclase, partial [Wenzhouxiangellaceae bacterium]
MTTATVEIHGTVAPGFERVRDAFAANFESGQEAGASFAATVEGEPVVDIWAGTREEGLYLIDDGRVESYGTDAPNTRRLAGDRITDLAVGANGGVWVATRDGGLDRIDRQGVSLSSRGAMAEASIAERDRLPSSGLTALHADDDRSLLVGSAAGVLYRIDRDMRILSRHRHMAGDPDSIAPGEILVIHVDPQGVIWTSSYAGGVSKTKSLSGKLAHDVVGFPAEFSRVVRAFWIDEDLREVWIGTSDGLAQLRPDPEGPRIFRHAGDRQGSLSDDVVYAVRRLHNGQLWVGTRTGLNRLHPETGDFERYLKGDGRGLPDNRVRDLAEDARGRLWIATQGGLARYDDETDRFTVFRSRPGSSNDDSNSLSSNELTALHVDEEGFIWIGTNVAGLNRLDPETGDFTWFEAGPDGLSHRSVWDAVRIGDTVWAATFSGGLNRIDLSSGSVTHFLERDGLANNVVYRIVPDDRGRLWLSTNASISVFDTEAGRFLNYNPRDGLQNYEYNSNAAFRDAAGRIWFGGVDGIDIINASVVETDASDASAVLTDFRLFNRPVVPEDDDRVELDARIEYANRLALGHQARVFSIGLSALHFANPDTNRLRYRLDGLHDEWLESDAGAHEVTFNSLDPGDYRFRVQAAARGAQWGPERTLEIRIHPPPWQSPWAYTGYAAALLILMLLVVRNYRQRIARERRRVEQLNAMVIDRTAELQRVNKKLQESNRRLEDAVRQDPLTGLGNRRELLEFLPREQPLSLRAYSDWIRDGCTGPEPQHARMCLLAVDIDDFKLINDTWGHLGGDQVLGGFATQLHDHCRASDLVVRWGGEEFLIVMRAATPELAQAQAERIRKSVQAQPIRLDDDKRVSLTCSIGFACYPFSIDHPEVGDWEDIVGLADAAMYAAKNAGKNTWTGIG